MCFPLNSLKIIVSYTAMVTMGLGLFSVICGIIIQSNTKELTIFEDTGHYMKDILIVSLYIFGSLLVIFGIIGVFGGKQKNVKLLTTFNIGQVINIIAFLIMTIFGFVIVSDFSNQSLNMCLTQDWSKPLNNATIQAEEYFCKVGYCKCDITDQTDWPDDYLSIYGITNIGSTNYENFQQCPEYSKIEQNNVNTLAQAEQKFQCAGWCYPSGVYLFTKANKGPPQTIGGCYVQTTLWMQYYGIVLGIVCLSVSSLLIVSMILTCCLCFHPKAQKPIDPDFRNHLYSRFTNYGFDEQ